MLSYYHDSTLFAFVQTFYSLSLKKCFKRNTATSQSQVTASHKKYVQFRHKCSLCLIMPQFMIISSASKKISRVSLSGIPRVFLPSSTLYVMNIIESSVNFPLSSEPMSSSLIFSS